MHLDGQQSLQGIDEIGCSEERTVSDFGALGLNEGLFKRRSQNDTKYRWNYTFN